MPTTAKTKGRPATAVKTNGRPAIALFLLYTWLTSNVLLSSEQEGAGHGSCGTDADESVARVSPRHFVGQRRQNSSAGCGPRMPDSNRAAIHVDPIPVHGTRGRPLPTLLPRRGIREHLRGEGLVDLDQVDIGKSKSDTIEQTRHRNGGRHEQPFARMQRCVLHGLDEGQRPPALEPRASLTHEEDGGCAVGDRRRVAGSQRPLGGERGLEGT